MSEHGLLYCVGATKAGTSRLYSALHEHPDCLVREVKEAHYWDTFGAEDKARQVAAYRQRLDEIRARVARLEANGKTWNAANLSRRMGDMIGLIEVLEGDRSGHKAYLAWLEQGAAGEPLLADFTPSYGLLDDDGLRRMLEVGPKSRVVFLIRDPLARLWSHVRMHAERNLGKAEEFVAKAHGVLWRILAKGQESHITERGDYATIIERLRRVVPAGQLCIEFAEQVFRPEGWAAMCRFLGIAPSRIDQNRRAHEGRPAVLRDDLAVQALEFLKDQYDWVARNVGPLPVEWQASLARVKA